jgi:hypothetical protein
MPSMAKTAARMSSLKVQATTQQKAASNESTINSWTLGFTSTPPDSAILRSNAPLCIHYQRLIWNRRYAHLHTLGSVASPAHPPARTRHGKRSPSAYFAGAQRR